MAKKTKKKPGQQFLSPEKYLKERARTLKIHKCYVSASITEHGEGHVMVSRRHTGGRISMAMYLVDTYCLGVKNSLYGLRMEEDEFEELVESAYELEECPYEVAHNWV